MRIIKPGRIHEFGRSFPDADSPLRAWLKVMRKARWRSLTDIRAAYPSADGVRVQSGRIVVVFNIGGNKYRLVVAVYYNKAKIYVLRFMAHAEYDKGALKKQL